MVRENEPTLLVMYVAESIRASKNESPIANNSRGWGGGQSFPTMQEVRATSVDHRKIAWKSRRANTKPLTFTSSTYWQQIYLYYTGLKYKRMCNLWKPKSQLMFAFWLILALQACFRHIQHYGTFKKEINTYDGNISPLLDPLCNKTE